MSPPYPTGPTFPPTRYPLAIAVICASNQNRSMEAHKVLSLNQFDVHSYGTGKSVRMPGPSPDKPNVYPFGTPYDAMYKDLMSKDQALYTRNGLLAMLDRNRNIKTAPERFVECPLTFDLIISCEEKCFDVICEELVSRPKILGRSGRPVHIINVDIKDTHKDSLVGAQVIKTLCELLSAEEDLDANVTAILDGMTARQGARFLHSVAFY